MQHNLVPIAALILLAAASPLGAATARDGVLGHYQKSAAQPASPVRGKALFEAQTGGGKPETPSCTSCHGGSPRDAGRTRAGKAIAPMAVSKAPERYRDIKKVEKWFRRNCRSVLGRVCTAQEKTDFLSYMTSR